MVTNNVTVYQFEVGLDEVFADEVRFHVNVDCVIVVVVKDCLFFMSFILCEDCEFVKWMCWMLAFFLSCDECSLRCAFSGSMLVSLCKCWMFVSDVHPVAIMSAMF